MGIGQDVRRGEQVAYIPGASVGGGVPYVAYRCVLVSSWFLHQMPALLWTPHCAPSGVAAYPAPPCPGQGERMLRVSLDSGVPSEFHSELKVPS